MRIDYGETGPVLTEGQFEDADLMEGDVTVRVTHSTANYKDGLAITGRSPVVRRFPMILASISAISQPRHVAS